MVAPKPDMNDEVSTGPLVFASHEPYYWTNVIATKSGTIPSTEPSCSMRAILPSSQHINSNIEGLWNTIAWLTTSTRFTT